MNKQLVIILVFLFIFLTCYQNTASCGSIKNLVIDTVGFSLLGGGIGLAYSYTIGDMPDDSEEKQEYIVDNVKKFALMGAGVGFIIGIVDVFDVFSGGKSSSHTQHPSIMGLNNHTSEKSFSRKFGEWSNGSLLTVNGQKIGVTFPGIRFGIDPVNSKSRGFCCTVNVLSVGL